MPIYEFKCSKCQELFELLLLNTDEKIHMQCPKCKSEDFERVLSTTAYIMGTGTTETCVGTQTRSCPSGSCATCDIPGPAR